MATWQGYTGGFDPRGPQPQRPMLNDPNAWQNYGDAAPESKGAPAAGGSWGGWNGGQATGTMPPSTFTGSFAWDPSNYQNNPAYQSRQADVTKEATRGALAKGTVFTNQAREDVAQRAGQVSAQFQNDDFGRDLTTFNTNYGIFGDNYNRGDNDRRFAAERADTGWGQARTSSEDARRWDSELHGRARTGQLDAWTRDDNLWGRWRAETGDQWGRGVDTWNMARTDRNDIFDQNLSLSDMIMRGRPQPL